MLLIAFAAGWSWAGSRAEARYLERETDIQKAHQTAQDALQRDFERRVAEYRDLETVSAAERRAFEDQISELLSRPPERITRTVVREVSNEGVCNCPVCADDNFVRKWNAAVTAAEGSADAGAGGRP